MKKIGALMLFVWLLVGCRTVAEEPPTEVRVERFGSVFVVNFETSTVLHRGEVFHFSRENHQTAITFPDGSQWEERRQGNMSSGSWIVGDMPESAAPFLASDLVRAIEDALPSPVGSSFNSGAFFGGIGLMALGAWTLKDPEAMWQRTRGWELRDAEPSENAIKMTGLGGFFEVVIGIGFIIAGFMG